jgi:hypothetical protein
MSWYFGEVSNNRLLGYCGWNCCISAGFHWTNFICFGGGGEYNILFLFWLENWIEEGICSSDSVEALIG